MLKWLEHVSDTRSAASELVWEVFGLPRVLAIHIAKGDNWEGAKVASVKRGQESCAGPFHQLSQWKELAPNRIWES